MAIDWYLFSQSGVIQVDPPVIHKTVKGNGMGIEQGEVFQFVLCSKKRQS